MERATANRRTGNSKGSSRDSRRGQIPTGKRPSKVRNTEAMSGSCDVCGSNSWDSDDIFMTATPGITEAAFETALAAVTNNSTNVSGMLRTVATGTGLSVFQLG